MKRAGIRICACILWGCIAVAGAEKDGVGKVSIVNAEENRQLCWMVGQDGNGEYVTSSPVVIVTFDDGVLAFAKTTAVSDTVVSYLAATDTNTYEMTYVAMNDEFGFATFEIDVEDVVEGDGGFLPAAQATIGEEAEIFYFYQVESNYEEHMQEIIITGCEELVEGSVSILTYEMVNDAGEIMLTPGAVLNADGECIGIFCPEGELGEDILTFTSVNAQETEAADANSPDGSGISDTDDQEDTNNQADTDSQSAVQESDSQADDSASGMDSSSEEEALSTRISRAVVRIAAYDSLEGEDACYGTGSGFGVGTAWEDTDIFVTNRHVVTDEDDGHVLEYIYLLLDDADLYDSSTLVECKVLYTTDGYPDFAILQAQEDISGFKALPLRSAQSVSLAEDVWAYGYPGLLDDDTGAWARNIKSGVRDLTVTKGIISRFMEFSLAGDTNVIVHDAHINSGNSGGPLVTEDGSVIGINTYSMGDPVAGVDDYGDLELSIVSEYSLAVEIDYVMEALDELGIAYDTAG